ncbi:CHAT domain-containing protein [Bradyrhizobium amphicarpaeae]|uniref:CHAT domain-containing protein n=1 Tax=Bradyrhizobium amphicarpaeae TaxID=1404768 RepID=A0A2U8PU54_9BRAD|nr:CHAT domain-containing protein [Bradyrhizobium amphicarpaeae]AWM01343.1 CHAT domain-containing protein [Bradyrhizobium amphicarpaeae]
MTAGTPRRSSGLVVLCRPAQWREAAIVLSCCPTDGFTPLLVIEPPPVTDDGYRLLYDAYVAVRNQRDAKVGTAMARQVASLTEVSALNVAVDAAAQALTPFRSWWRHQRSLGGLLAGQPPRRAILLFDPSPGELDLIEAVPVSRIGPDRTPVLPNATERILLDPGLDTLAMRAWSACGRDTAFPIPQGPEHDDAFGWFAALASALKTGRPLAPGAAACPDLPAAEATEAILVEIQSEPDATALIGVQYAHERRALLVLTPAPDTAAISDALAAMSGRSGDKLFATVRDWWRSLTESPDIAGPLQAIEAAVNDAVPDVVVTAIGERDLTVFTYAVPYSFVRKCGADWVGKTIGHVAGDPTLIVLTELLDTPATDTIGFTLLFDTGEFDTNETADVLHVLNDRPAIVLLLSGAAAAGLNLIRLGELLPIEFIHFNTHGNQQEIVLADGELPAWKLFRSALPSRPFVFNNSCLSWVGVGREFIRTGARGYIGTLWPVDAEQAARLARSVLERTVQHGWSIARAIRQTGVDRHTDRAYIFAGTASAQLATLSDNRSRREALAKGIRQLLNALLRSLAQGSGGPPGIFIRPMQELLWTVAGQLIDVLDQRWPAPDADRLDIASDRLSVMARQAEDRQDHVPARAAEVAAAQSLLDRAGLADAGRTLSRGLIHYHGARIALAESRIQDTLDLLAEDGSTAVLNLRSDALRAAGQMQEAFATAERALASVQPDDRRQRLFTLGRVGQLARINHDEERALDVARDGFALATELDDLKERAKFKGDETRALLVLQRAQEAVASARLYRDLARHAFGDREDLSAAGALVQALTMAGETQEADQVARQALDNARAMNQPARAAQFLLDRARICAVEDRLHDAIALGFESATAFADCRAMDGTRQALGLTTEFLNQAHRDQLPGWPDLFRLAVSTQRALLPKVSPDLQSAIATETASQLAKLTAAGKGL